MVAVFGSGLTLTHSNPAFLRGLTQPALSYYEKKRSAISPLTIIPFWKCVATTTKHFPFSSDNVYNIFWERKVEEGGCNQWKDTCRERGSTCPTFPPCLLSFVCRGCLLLPHTVQRWLSAKLQATEIVVFFHRLVYFHPSHYVTSGLNTAAPCSRSGAARLLLMSQDENINSAVGGFLKMMKGSSRGWGQINRAV